MCQCSKKLVTYKYYSCFNYSDFLANSVFTFDVCWGSLGTSIYENSSLAANNTRSRLPSRLSFCFLWIWDSDIQIWFCLMMPCEKGKFPYFFPYFWTNGMTSQPQNWQIFIFLSSLSLWTWHYFQTVLIRLHILKWILKQVAEPLRQLRRSSLWHQLVVSSR